MEKVDCKDCIHYYRKNSFRYVKCLKMRKDIMYDENHLCPKFKKKEKKQWMIWKK